MELTLNNIEVRVLGALIEKELTTPEYYPLSLNALSAACNQKSNRNPVMSLEETDVVRALESLRTKQLAWRRSTAGSRVSKYEHNFMARWKFSPQQVAAMCVLMLRGPQTIGEIRGRTGRMYAFSDLADVEVAINTLITHEEGPFVIELPRLPGRKENRFTHLLAGEPSLEESAVQQVPLDEATLVVQAENERISALEEQMSQVKKELEELNRKFAEFKKEFE